MISRKHRRQTVWSLAMRFLSIAVMLLVAPGMVSATPRVQVSETPFQVTMRDGTMIRVTCSDESVLWKTVSMTGDVVESQLGLDEIKSITFARESASEQVSAIRKLIDSLNDDDYRARNEAESKLVTTGLPFIDIIEQFRGHTEPEAKYRLARVLDRLKNESDETVIPTSLQFDTLETTDGRIMEGDIGDWSLPGRWNDMEVNADRKNCSGIAVATNEMNHATRDSAGEPVTSSNITSINHFLDNQKPKPETTFVDFQTGNDKVALHFGIKEPVGKFFTFAGCLLQCDSFGGDVVISGYKFKKGISREISLCNLYVDPDSGKSTRYNGVLRIEFCVPGQPGMAAGVHAAGTGAEIVVPKQTLVEAWNSAGHVIGLTYATDEKNSFLGAKSNETIIALTVGANRYLNLEKINEDYAIDDLCFSKPIAVYDLNRVGGDGTSVIITRDGNRLMVDSIKFQSDEPRIDFVLKVNQQSSSLPVANINWIVGPQDGLPTSRQFDGISVMTGDGSVIHTSSTGLVSIDNPELVIPADQVIGVWNPLTPARYPRPDDFENSNTVVVRPLQRIASSANLDWAKGTVEFDMENSTTIRQTVRADAQPANGPEESTTFADSKAQTVIEDFEVVPVAGTSFRIAELGNVWTAAPSLRAEGTGLLRTNDGQQFVLGGTSGFSLTKIDGTVVTISRDGQSLSFELTQIYALEFPNE